MAYQELRSESSPSPGGVAEGQRQTVAVWWSWHIWSTSRFWVCGTTPANLRIHPSIQLQNITFWFSVKKSFGYICGLLLSSHSVISGTQKSPKDSPSPGWWLTRRFHSWYFYLLLGVPTDSQQLYVAISLSKLEWINDVDRVCWEGWENGLLGRNREFGIKNNQTRNIPPHLGSWDLPRVLIMLLSCPW